MKYKTFCLANVLGLPRFLMGIIACATMICHPFIANGITQEEKSKVTSVTKFKNVELNNLEQAKRLIGMESSVSASSCTITAKNKLINGKSQDLVTCETIYTREKYQFEFDDLSDPDNSENGTVYKSLQAYFCTNSINDRCMKRVKDVWGGDASAGQKKPDEPKKETEKINKYSNLQLHDLNQAERLLKLDYPLIDFSTCTNKTSRNQDFLTCSNKPVDDNNIEFEFDDLSDRDNKENGTVYQSLQTYFCKDENDKKSMDSTCMRFVLEVWGGESSNKPVSDEEQKLRTAFEEDIQLIIETYNTKKTQLEKKKAEEQSATEEQPADPAPEAQEQPTEKTE